MCLRVPHPGRAPGRPLWRGRTRGSKPASVVPVPRLEAVVHGSAPRHEPAGTSRATSAWCSSAIQSPKTGKPTAKGFGGSITPRAKPRISARLATGRSTSSGGSNGNLDGISPKLAVVMIGTNNSAATTSRKRRPPASRRSSPNRGSRRERRCSCWRSFPRGQQQQLAPPTRQANADHRQAGRRQEDLLSRHRPEFPRQGSQTPPRTQIRT